MRNLLIAFLLAVFSLQGAVAAIGDDRTGSGRDPAGPAWSQAFDGLADCAGAAAEDSEVSSTIEELSDYVPLDMPVPQGRYPVPAPPLSHVRFLSIDLPTTEPPPRA